MHRRELKDFCETFYILSVKQVLKKSPGILIVRNPLRIFFTSFKKSLQEKLYKFYIYNNTISDRLVFIIINQFYILEQVVDILVYAVVKKNIVFRI